MTRQDVFRGKYLYIFEAEELNPHENSPQCQALFILALIPKVVVLLIIEIDKQNLMYNATLSDMINLHLENDGFRELQIHSWIHR